MQKQIRRDPPPRSLAAAASALAGDTSGIEIGEIAAFSALIGAIYEAAVEPARWPAVLVMLREFVGGSETPAFDKNAGEKNPSVCCNGSAFDPSVTHLYRDTCARLDPSGAGRVPADIGQPICSGGFMPSREFQDAHIDEEPVQPQRCVDFVSAMLDRSARGTTICGAFRNEEHVLADDQTHRRVRQIVPHIRRAVLICKMIERERAKAATFADTLDGLSAGMFLVDAAGRIIHANTSGQSMLAEGKVRRGANGKLMVTDSTAAAALGEALAWAGHGDAAAGTEAIALALPDNDGAVCAAHVLPLASRARRRAGASSGTVAAVFVRKTAFDLSSAPAAIARHYGLTASEVRVLFTIVQLGGVADTAEALGVREATVKTHLHRLFRKTGAARQSDLVKLVAGFSSPLVA